MTEVARGGSAAVSNLRLRCRAHNQYGAERTFGAEFMRDVQGGPPRLIVDRGLKTMVPLTAADPVAWSEAHGIFPQPHIEDFFGFLHARYTLAARVSDMDIYVLQIDEVPCECH